jgi:hypothetical protein
MIYKYEGNTYTAQAMQKKLRYEYKERGMRTWNLASLDEMIKHAQKYGISEIEQLRQGKHKAERHITVMVVPHEAQLFRLWELDVPLEHCIFVENVLYALYQMGPRIIKYAIFADGTYTANIFDRVQEKKS